MTPTPDDILRDVFRHESFRGSQREVSLHVAAGNDAVVLFPTGAGKSLCFQVPGLCRPGVVIVVSPLVALMRDQVAALRRVGVSASALYSDQPAEEERAVRSSLRDGGLKFLYVTPERVATEGFWTLLEGVEVALLAIDEAHCVSTWGHDFRPDYMKLGRARARLPGVPMVALTATADPQTREDLGTRLGLTRARTFMSSFDRPNISYEIVEKRSTRDQLLAFLDGERGNAGIVYCLSRRETETVAEFLRKAGFEALPYHAGPRPQAVRDRQPGPLSCQGGWPLPRRRHGRLRHGHRQARRALRRPSSTCPASVEAYYQETGRAGRDGRPSRAWMCYGPEDVAQRQRMIDEGDASPTGKLTQRRQARRPARPLRDGLVPQGGHPDPLRGGARRAAAGTATTACARPRNSTGRRRPSR